MIMPSMGKGINIGITDRVDKAVESSGLFSGLKALKAAKKAALAKRKKDPYFDS